MSNSLAQSQEAVRRAGGASRLLLAISVVLLAALGGIFAYLLVRQDSLRDGIREDALWAVYQLDRETRTLAQTIDRVLAAGTSAANAVESLTQRYDILYSRLSLLDSGKYALLFEHNLDIERQRTAARQLILELQPYFDEMAASGHANRGVLEEAGSMLLKLQHSTERILTSTNASLSAARADAREDIMRLQTLSAAIVIVLVLTITLLIVNLMRHIRIVRAASEGLALTAQELTAAYRAAEAGNLAKSEFMATMGHEIRTPLAAILGMAELLSHSLLGSQERRYVSVITSSGSSLLGIINEILDFSKLEHGKMTVESLPLNVAELIRDVACVVEGQAVERETRIELLLDDLPTNVGHLTDPTLLRRVLLNLLGNAVKFTRKGIARVRATEVAGDGRLRFEIADTGIGISPEARDRLFRPFTQVDGSIARQFGGTGLGLAICKTIVDSLGGTIGVESVFGVGSKFWFEIPAPRITISPAAAGIAAEPSTPLPKLTVLVVEDNLINREVIASFLEKLGQGCLLAADGAEGVRLAASEKPDLVLMDMQMPTMDGIAATRLIRQNDRTTPVIALTANASDHDRQRCEEAGMNDFVAKPITMKRLSALIACHGTRLAISAGKYPHASVETVQNASPEPERADELAAAIDQSELRHLIDTFLDEAPKLLRGTLGAIEANDMQALDRMLHSLKGAALTLGFGNIAKVAQSCRDNPADSDGLRRLEQEIGKLANKTTTLAA